MHATGRFLDDEKKADAYNVGSVDQVEVKKIAKVVAEEMGLRDVNFVFTGGVDRGRGWLGDVKIMLLSIDKLMKTRWKPKYKSEQAVRLAVKSNFRREIALAPKRDLKT
jgi:UDP-glucose 4-epimerase